MTDTEISTAEPAGPRTVEVVVSVPTVLKAVGIFFALLLAYLVRDALLSIALSAVMILGLDPPVSALERRGWGRGKAALAVFGFIALVLSVIVIWAAKPIWREITAFVDDLPAHIDKAQHSGVLEDVDKETDAFKKLESVAAEAAKNLPSAAVNLLGAAAGIVGSVFSLVTLTFLTLFGLLAKPQLTRSAVELMRPEHGGRFERILGEVCNAISFTLIGNIVISVIAGTVVGVTAVIIGAPSPMVLALIVGLLDLVPQIGATIAAVIVTLFTLIASGPADGRGHARGDPRLPAGRELPDPARGHAPGGRAVRVRDHRRRHGRRLAARRGRRDPRCAGRRLGEGRPPRADRGPPRTHGRAQQRDVSQRSAGPAVTSASPTRAAMAPASVPQGRHASPPIHTPAPLRVSPRPGRVSACHE